MGRGRKGRTDFLRACKESGVREVCASRNCLDTMKEKVVKGKKEEMD